jgi:hypothetical protein
MTFGGLRPSAKRRDADDTLSKTYACPFRTTQIVAVIGFIGRIFVVKFVCIFEGKAVGGRRDVLGSELPFNCMQF